MDPTDITLGRVELHLPRLSPCQKFVPVMLELESILSIVDDAVQEVVVCK